MTIRRLDDWRVELERTGDMRVVGRVFADPTLFAAIQQDATLEQVANVATLPGIVRASLAMPDAHQGYGFPIGGVAATDVAEGGVVSPGGVGFDINCGVRLLASDLQLSEVRPRLAELADALYQRVPVGFRHARRELGSRELDQVLQRGAAWVVEQGFGTPEDLERAEERGGTNRAVPRLVSARARERGAGQLGTLGSGNHFVEVQHVDAVYDPEVARVLGLSEGQVVVLVHTGSRGLGHQVASDYIKVFRSAMRKMGLHVPDAQLACAPVDSPEGRDYLGAMFSAANFAWANRQMITHRVREAFGAVFGKPVPLRLVYDVAHNMAKLEEHEVDGRTRQLCVHRKGATRAFPPGHPDVPRAYRGVGQPVFVPGSMGTASYCLVGTEQAMTESFGSVCHGAGRVMSRKAATRTISAAEVAGQLARQGIEIRAGSKAGIVEEFPGAYKDVHEVVGVVEGAGLARRVARMRPLGVVKG